MGGGGLDPKIMKDIEDMMKETKEKIYRFEDQLIRNKDRIGDFETKIILLMEAADSQIAEEDERAKTAN
jgi:hypothetical protein